MSLSVPERLAQVAEHFARHDAHGYSQPNRGTGRIEEIALSDGSTATISGSDVDCSEMVRQCVNCALSGRLSSPIVYMWTGSEHAQLTAHGFERLPYSEAAVRRGDVLWVDGHTGVALGNGLQADAHGDEYGGITGPNRGDQTGREVEVRRLRPWTCIYRHEGGSQEEGAFTVQAKVEFPDGVNIRERPTTKSKIVGSYPKGGTCVLDGVVLADGIPWGTYVGASSGLRRYVALGHLDIARVVA